MSESRLDPEPALPTVEAGTILVEADGSVTVGAPTATAIVTPTTEEDEE